ncbi:hypothetical protein [Planctomycetes bacterium K23_9]
MTTTASAESWTDLNGTRTIEARMMGLWNDSVVLQLQDGRKVTVALNNLNAQSRIQAQKLSRDKVQTRNTLIGELKGQAAEAAAPAPTPLPTPSPAATYVPPASGGTCIAQLQWEADQTRAGHLLRASLDALPMSYRADVNNYVKAALSKSDPALNQTLASGLQKTGDMIVTRQRWLLSHPRLAALQPSAFDTVKGVLLNVGGLMRTGFDPKAFDLATMQSMPFDQWLGQRSDEIAPYLAALMNLPGFNFPTPSFEAVSEKDGVAVVKITYDGAGSNQSFTQVDGFWVPTSTATDWETNMAEENKKLAEMPNGGLVPEAAATIVAGMIGANLDPIMQAQNEKDFHAAMEPVFMQLSPLIAQLPTMLGAQGNRRGNDMMNMDMEMGMGMDDMGEEMEMEMEMEMQMNQDMGMNQ